MDRLLIATCVCFAIGGTLIIIIIARIGFYFHRRKSLPSNLSPDCERGITITRAPWFLRDTHIVDRPSSSQRADSFHELSPESFWNDGPVGVECVDETSSTESHRGYLQTDGEELGEISYHAMSNETTDYNE